MSKVLGVLVWVICGGGVGVSLGALEWRFNCLTVLGCFLVWERAVGSPTPGRETGGVVVVETPMGWVCVGSFLVFFGVFWWN